MGESPNCMELIHKPVLVKETLSFLNPCPGQVFIDGTVGDGGHAMEILALIGPAGKLFAFDRDEKSIERSRSRLQQYAGRVEFVHASFAEMGPVLSRLGMNGRVNGVLLDLGLAWRHYKSNERGFSYDSDEPLDMRLDRSQKLTAAEVVNGWPEDKLIWVFQEYGQENFSTYIAAEICRLRRQNMIRSTRQLTEVVLLAIRNKLGSSKHTPWVGGLHPATKVFQAIRIAVNDELGHLSRGLSSAIDVLGVGGRCAVISFHSLEDRIVKNFFRQESRDCLDPPEQPTCTCGHRARVRILTKKVVSPSSIEQKHNPASRSAKLRVAEKIS
ncbi:MAG TPA: 16S rRNA (cytosine(1402)-N(4))-methyltransferase [Candidatus Kerfeldbacteria bacterium]|nr:MAG: Ribosomal RNA small subunit methyltransferase H [Parcubacteria group bacterium GW2011_GWA2_48_9]KKW15240.1 MAG: Ribosomal RNA small subunit methyltransferase H [Parcubacteria group bacterium GW2011_GWC2_49_9]HCJ52923.1 16S rRNA (cytosine(1402)-N(4))-methyltransferase [Candidatus Kerfeldbacteria bacterium]HCM68607.1 16S rRNA (cytosine(1402)-N(4))-methyltransferase [Candidatus Kerfeldbacteria bacterium]